MPQLGLRGSEELAADGRVEEDGVPAQVIDLFDLAGRPILTGEPAQGIRERIIRVLLRRLVALPDHPEIGRGPAALGGELLDPLVGVRLAVAVRVGVGVGVAGSGVLVAGGSVFVGVFVTVGVRVLVLVAVAVAVRDAVAKKDASINVHDIVLTATHTHTAPVLQPGTPGIPVNDQTMTVEETLRYLADKISDGIVAAWKNVAPGKMSYGLDRNSIGFSRRAVYAYGSVGLQHASMAVYSAFCDRVPVMLPVNDCPNNPGETRLKTAKAKYVNLIANSRTTSPSYHRTVKTM